MLGVAKEISPFLVVLFFIILGFGLAFFILLRSANLWDLTTKYNSFNPDGSINYDTPILIQTPDSNTNMFNGILTSLLAMYLFLIGNNLIITFKILLIRLLI
jgi:hypothetical protein